MIKRERKKVNTEIIDIDALLELVSDSTEQAVIEIERMVRLTGSVA